MSLRDSWASHEPSRNSTSECTIDCGWTTTSIRSGGSANKWLASISSRPLFMSVAESTLILAPIAQVGWRSASSGRMWSQVSRGRSRNGPPEAVSTSRRTSSRRPPRSAWWRATCSLSIGRMRVPRALASRVSSRPAATSDSLLASARSLPASSAACTGRRPAAPTIAATTRPAPGWVAASSRPVSPTASRTPGGSSPRTAAAAPASTSATRSGWNSRAWATSASGCRPKAASATMRSLSGWWRTTSSALAPIEPVEPSSATPRVIESIGSWGHADQPQPEQEGRRREEHRVHAVEHAAVTGQDAAGVLDPGGALEQRLDEIAHLRRHRRPGARGEQRPAHAAELEEAPHRGRGDADQKSRDRSLPGLLGAHHRRHAPPPQVSAGVERRGVAEPDDRAEQEDHPRIVLLQPIEAG